MLFLFGHAGEIHTSTAEAASHVNILPTLLLLGGFGLAAGVFVYWMLNDKAVITRDEEDKE